MLYQMEEAVNCNANIKVIGIGGGGCNAVNRMIEMKLAGVDFIAGNTDVQALAHCQAQTTLQIGAGLTRGLGAGGNPKVGREAALEDEERIHQILEGSDMVFITAGMGGGTGTGGAPIIAQIARDLGALTIAVVTKPFRFEGPHRMEIAEGGIHDLEEFVDTLITIPNQKLLSTVERTTTLKDAFKLADEVLCNAVQGISDLITVPGLINLDFADVRTIMTGQGKALMGTGFGSGESKAVDAVRRAISSPLLDDMSVDGASGILINITGGDDLTLLETDEAIQMIQEAADEKVHIIFGAVVSDEYHGNVKATVIATGFEATRVRQNPGSFRIGKIPSVFQDPSRESEEESDESEETIAPEPFEPEMEQTVEYDVPEDTEDPDNSEFDDVDVLDSVEEDTAPLAMEDSVAPERSVAQPAVQHDITQEILTSEEPSVHRPPPRPELQLRVVSAPLEQFDRLPAYEPRDLKNIQLKRESEVDMETIPVESSNYMIPAILRRKAD